MKPKKFPFFIKIFIYNEKHRNISNNRFLEQLVGNDLCTVKIDAGRRMPDFCVAKVLTRVVPVGRTVVFCFEKIQRLLWDFFVTA